MRSRDYIWKWLQSGDLYKYKLYETAANTLGISGEMMRALHIAYLQKKHKEFQRIYDTHKPRSRYISMRRIIP